MKIRREVEDSALQAGWIFADLFLALTVIFLATVSYIPSLGKPDANLSRLNLADSKKSISQLNSMKDKYSPKLVLISNGFIGEYSSSSTKSFIKNFQEYLLLKDIGDSAKAIYIEAIGHTTGYNVKNDAGNLDALKFLINIRKSLPSNFEGVPSAVNLSPEVPSGRVRIKVTFV